MAARTTISSWAPFLSHVQNDIPSAGSFVDSKVTLIAAGPALLSAVGSNSDVAYPIGVGENFGVNQTKQMNRLMEIGSALHYMVPGHVIGQANLGRVVYNGRSLLNVLYAAGDYTTPKTSPGDNFWNNIASDVFNTPFGLLVYMMDNNLIPYAAMYLEQNYIQGHQIQFQAQNTIITEATSTQFMRSLPVRLPRSAQTQIDRFLT